MRSSTPPRASVTALSLGTSSSIGISLFCRNTLPCRLTESVNGSRSWSRLLAWVCGRSIVTPTVRSGADTMKMMSSTSITSTMGVTLISLITALRRCRRLPTGPPIAAPPIAMLRSPALKLCALVDLPRQDGGKFVREPLQALRLLVHLGTELVIENGRRYGGHKPDGGCEQRLRDAGRHHGKRGVVRRRDRLQARHDTPDRAEQADERPRGTDGREHQEAALQPLDFPHDGDIHHLF